MFVFSVLKQRSDDRGSAPAHSKRLTYFQVPVAAELSQRHVDLLLEACLRAQGTGAATRYIPSVVFALSSRNAWAKGNPAIGSAPRLRNVETDTLSAVPRTSTNGTAPISAR